MPGPRTTEAVVVDVEAMEVDEVAAAMAGEDMEVTLVHFQSGQTAESLNHYHCTVLTQPIAL